MSTGHYSQLVWAETDRLGCGSANFQENGMWAFMLVCNYAVAGNMQGGSVYKRGNQCSQCEDGLGCDMEFDALCG